MDVTQMCMNEVGDITDDICDLTSTFYKCAVYTVITVVVIQWLPYKVAFQNHP